MQRSSQARGLEDVALRPLPARKRSYRKFGDAPLVATSFRSPVDWVALQPSIALCRVRIPSRGVAPVRAPLTWSAGWVPAERFHTTLPVTGADVPCRIGIRLLVRAFPGIGVRRRSECHAHSDSECRTGERSDESLSLNGCQNHYRLAPLVLTPTNAG